MMKKLSSILDTLSPDQALAILKLLAKEDKGFKTKLLQIARDYLGQVDAKETAAEVRTDLESLDVHDVWDEAGSNSYGGYQEPGEVAWEMVEDTLKPYIEQLEKYIKLKMTAQAEKYCQGIVKGIKDYQQKSGSEFKDWAGDVFSESINTIMDTWNKSRKNLISSEDEQNKR